MPRIDYSDYKDHLVVYMINLLQPCTAADLLTTLRTSTIAAFKQINRDELEQILKRADDQGIVLRTKGGHLHLTYAGFRMISKMRLAFPRDKNRLFYLKNVVTGGRDRD
jgi:hypothetical protein